MPLPNIESLCAGYCEGAGIAVPAIVPDGAGLRSFTLHVRDVDIYVQQLDSLERDCVFVAADLGEPPAASERYAWRVLMRANGRMPGEKAPLFSRNPATGRAMLQWAYPLSIASGSDFGRRFSALVDVAREWRIAGFLDDPDCSFNWFVNGFGPAATSPAQSEAANARFEALYSRFARTLGKDFLSLPQADEVQRARAFSMQVDGVDVFVAHSVYEDPESVFLMLPLRAQHGETELAALTAAMDLNFQLATHARRTRVVAEESSGEHLVMHALPAETITPRALVEAARQLAAAVHPATLPPVSFSL